MSQAQDICDYLGAIAPEGATNTELAHALGIRSHQTVYMTTQGLVRQRKIRGEQEGVVWRFYAPETPAERLTARLPALAGGLTPQDFAALAQRVLGDHYDAELRPGAIPGVRKEFALVSDDGQVVGDARYAARVGPERFAAITELVWLLEKTGAPETFLVFGNDRETPRLWLQRYGNLLTTVAFYFLGDDGRLEELSRAL
jgi:hypothetical protein